MYIIRKESWVLKLFLTFEISKVTDSLKVYLYHKISLTNIKFSHLSLTDLSDFNNFLQYSWTENPKVFKHLEKKASKRWSRIKVFKNYMTFQPINHRFLYEHQTESPQRNIAKWEWSFKNISNFWNFKDNWPLTNTFIIKFQI